MRQRLTRALSSLLLVAAPVPAIAQGLPTTQPAYLLIIREDVKAGRAADHARLEASWPAAFERANSPDYYLAMESTTSSEAWFVIPFASFSAMGEMQARERGPALGPELDKLRRADAEFINGWRAVELRARPDLSAGAYPEIARQRFWEISIFRMRPGGQTAFADVAKAYAAAAKKIGRASGFRVYEVSAGMPEPTFFVFNSVSSFADFDKLRSDDDATLQSMLSEPVEKLLAAWNDKLINSESFRLALSPEMSYVPKDVRASDPAFWGPKKSTPAKPAPAAKPSTGTQP